MMIWVYLAIGITAISSLMLMLMWFSKPCCDHCGCVLRDDGKSSLCDDCLVGEMGRHV